jgi:hypothetical protein
MRYRLMAIYLGVPYHVGLGPDGNEATLFSPAPPPDELGFTAAGGYWRKQVLVADLDALWQARLVGAYRGEPALVLEDLGDRLHIAYLGRDSARARQLGYWEIDREVFEVVVARQDIGGLTEEREDYPLASAMFPPSNRDPAAQARTQAPARGATGPRPPAGEPRPQAGEPQPQAGEPAAAELTSPLRVVSRLGPQPAKTTDRVAAWHGSPEAEPWAEVQSPAEPELQGGPPSGRRAGRRDRVPQSVFAELLTLAAIPHAAYAVDEEVPGAMCLVKADGGFEVFSRTDDARLDVRLFEDEEAAYFYLFGVLAAEAVHSGRLRPGTVNGHVNGSRGAGVPLASSENVSKYLRGAKLAKSLPHPVIVN